VASIANYLVIITSVIIIIIVIGIIIVIVIIIINLEKRTQFGKVQETVACRRRQ